MRDAKTRAEEAHRRHAVKAEKIGEAFARARVEKTHSVGLGGLYFRA